MPTELFHQLLFNHLWQSTVFAGGAGLLTLALRSNRARVRHAIWLAASLKFLIPFSLFVTLGSQIQWRKTEIAAPSNFAIVMDQVSEPFTTSALPPAARPSPVPRAIPWPAILWSIWACGFLVISAAWLIRWLRIRAALRAGSPVQLDIPIRANTSPTTLEPGVFGVFSPILLLPNGIVDRLTPAQLESVIEHELCHVRHRDNLASAIHMFVETVLWFHPLVWWIGKRMVAERERACDEAVLLIGGEPTVYAEAILNVCKFYVESPLACVAGITGAGLKQRIEDIVKNRTGAGLNRTKKFLLTGATAAAVITPLALGVMNAPAIRAQSPAEPIPKWEVVAIKPCDASAPQGRSGGKGGGPSPGHLAINCVTPSQLIENAYLAWADGRTMSFNRAPIENLPGWAKTDRYVVEAKPEAPQSRAMMYGPMMRTLLEERFKLKIRREPREMPVYNLTVAKGGPKQMNPSRPDSCIAFDFDHPPPPPSEKPGERIELCEMIGRGVTKGASQGEFTGFGFTMTRFAEQLGALLDRPVIDKTGITGKWDMKVPIPVEDLTPPTVDPNRDRPFDQYRDDEMIFSAMKQLGLRLEPVKGPGMVLVVDSIERPTDNFTEPKADAPARVPPVAAKPAPQRPAAVVEDKPLRFDAASLKPDNPSGGRGMGAVPRSVGAVPRAGRGAGRLQFTTGRVAGVVVNTRILLREAYGVKDYQFVGLPSWVQSDRYDFEGKADDAATESQLRQMMQTFLADRFGLTMHRATVDMTVLAMTVGKDGIKAPLADAPEPAGFQAAQDQYTKHMVASRTFDALADTLSSAPFVDIPVIDKTGLTGNYKFLMGWDDDDDFLPSVARNSA